MKPSRQVAFQHPVGRVDTPNAVHVQRTPQKGNIMFRRAGANAEKIPQEALPRWCRARLIEIECSDAALYVSPNVIGMKIAM
jgi:hypothetical protein